MTGGTLQVTSGVNLFQNDERLLSQANVEPSASTQDGHPESRVPCDGNIRPPQYGRSP